MRIIGISGKKQSGKDTAGNYITGLVLKQNLAVRDFRISDTGYLDVLTIYQDGSEDWGILDLKRRDAEFVYAAENTIWPYVKVYSFADTLKSLAVDLFELDPKSVYGNEEQRAAPTHLLWEDMPGVVTYDTLVHEWGHPKGAMSGREFLQFFGTEIGRKMHRPLWINATINKILAEQPEFALITDIRFPDEVNAIQKIGGEVVRLYRNSDSDDSHESENALNPQVFDWGQFDHVIDNRNLSIDAACKTICKALMI